MILSEYNNIGKTQNQTQSGNWEDVLPGAGGLIGSLFQPEGLIPGAATSGLGGGIGETARQGIRAFTGRGFDPGQIARSTGEQAAYGAIPGGQEFKALRNLPQVGKLLEPLAAKGLKGGIARTVARGGTGYLGGATAGLISGEQPGQAQSQGGMVGAVNAISPLIGHALNLVPKGVSKLGGIAVGSAQRVLERKNQPYLAAIQHLFGKEAIGTGAGKSVVNKDVQAIIDKYQLPIPPQGDINAFKPALDKASQAVEDKLQPILKDPINSIKASEANNIILKNKGTFFGADRKAQQTFPLDVQKLFSKRDNTNVSLSDLKQAQRELGKVAGFGTPNPTPLEKFAQKSYRDFGDIIDKKLATVDKAEYKSLINEHKILVKARDSYQGVTKGKGTLPVELTSKELAQEKAQGGLAGERLRELGVRSIPLVAGGAAQIIPGVPKQVKEAAALGAGLYGAAEFGPHLNPQKALQIGGSMANTPQVGVELQRLLQQLGVRLPGMGQ